MKQDFKAIRFHEYGGSENLVLDTTASAPPGADEVLVEVYFAGVNPIDWKIRGGYLKEFMPVPLPYTPGVDFSGVVAEVGSAVKDIKIGQAVFGIGKGTYAQYALAKAADIVLKPDNVSFEMAATVPLGALTAWQAVADSGAAKDLSVVVQGAAGGVGLFAVQFAALKGAKVTGIASEKNLTFVKTLGAERAVAYDEGAAVAEIRDVDVVIDLAGGKALEKAYDFLRKGGTLVTVAGRVSEEKAKALGIKALNSGRGPTSRLKEIAELLAKGKIRAESGSIFELAKAKEAQDMSQMSHARGRILLKVK
jgi:NADPH:quinone reductase-like Zn-dependent oxidoreductase